MAIWLTSDLHFCHDQEFVWRSRGYSSVEEMNREQIRKWNEVVQEEDEVWILGDLMLNDNVTGADCLRQLKGHIHVVLGNHDTDVRAKIYEDLGFTVQFGGRLKYKKKKFALSHWPTITENGEEALWQRIWNLHGHTHSKVWWSQYSCCYNVNIDAHEGYPVNLDQIIEEIQDAIRL